MIANPPYVIRLLRGWHLIRRDHPAADPAAILSLLFAQAFGRVSYPVFLALYHLYLQSIPLETAKAAWGLTQTKPAPCP